MRYLLLIGLALAGCTKANPDLLGFGGGGDLSTPGGGIGGGGGGAGGGGGEPADLSVSVGDTRDMAHGPDLAGYKGVACGAMSCMGGEDCCVNNQGPHCVPANGGCTNGPLFSCDGPEDCGGNLAPTCCLELTNSGGNGTKPIGSGCQFATDTTCSAILCHALSDCPATGGYVGCCAIPNSTLHRCSKTACM